MAPGQFGTVLRRIQRMFGAQAAEEQADHRLLERFAAGRDEDAFAALLQRHGPMVLRLCKSILQHEQDAEDVFQAAFLILAQKCGSIRRPDALASWLYGVAYRLCLRSKVQRQRRQTNQAVEQVSPPPEAAMQELHAILYEELYRLPECYRQPLLLCHVQGLSHSEACGELGLARGSMTYRLKTAEEQLRKRLVKRGVTLSVGMLAGLTGEALAVPPRLVEGTLKAAVLLASGQAAGGLISTQVATLTRGGMQMLLWQKLKVLVIAGTGAAMLTAAVGWTIYQAQAVPVPNTKTKETVAAPKPVLKDGLEVLVKPAKPKFFEREGISFVITFTNRSTKGIPMGLSQYLGTTTAGSYAYHIKNTQTNQSWQLVRDPNPGPLPGAPASFRKLVLEPGKSLDTRIGLPGIGRIFAQAKKPAQMQRTLPKGTYVFTIDMKVADRQLTTAPAGFEIASLPPADPKQIKLIQDSARQQLDQTLARYRKANPNKGPLGQVKSNQFKAKVDRSPNGEIWSVTFSAPLPNKRVVEYRVAVDGTGKVLSGNSGFSIRGAIQPGIRPQIRPGLRPQPGPRPQPLPPQIQ